MRWTYKSRLVVAALALLVLTGCRSITADDYLSVTVHDDSYSALESADTITVTSYDEMMAAINDLVLARAETGTLRVENFEGDVVESAAAAIYEYMRLTPEGAYYVDYINHDCTRIISYYEIHLYFTYREDTVPIDEIESVYGTFSLYSRLRAAMEAHAETLTFYVVGAEDIDLQTAANEYYEADKAAIVACPVVESRRWPEAGNEFITEITLNYGEPASLVTAHAQMISRVLDSAADYVSSCETETEEMEMLWHYLLDRFSYAAGTSNEPLYSLLFEGIADSASFADTVQTCCDRLGIECWTVKGYRGGETSCWNIVCLDGLYCHVDMMQAAMTGESDFTPLFDEDMTERSWDSDAYPACPAQENAFAEKNSAEDAAQPHNDPADIAPEVSG